MAGCSRVLLVLVLGILSLTACGSMRPVPASFNQADYTPIDFDLLRRDSSSLHAGDLIRCQAFFWQFLTYDPAPGFYYLNQLRYPSSWGDLEWFALYKDTDMQGYYDRGAMSHHQWLEFNPKRLEPIIIYGELVTMGGSKLYLLVHHLERLVID
jgi:hypothetical protein